VDIEQYNEYGKELERMFKLRSLPIALKFFEKAEDVPREALYPKRDLGGHMSVCQAWAYTRMKGLTIAMKKEDHWCWNPLIGYGCVECLPGQPQFEEVIKYISIPDHDKATEFFKNFPRLPMDKYEAVVTAPLATASFVPDVVLIYAEVAKINHMVRCIKSATGNYVSSVFDGIDSCIYATVPSFQKNEYRITFPDPGDRERARARDDEVILTVPGQRMKEFMDAVEQADRHMGFNDKGFDVCLNHNRPPFYVKLFEMWGLDKA
jgi:uncharacterized protein (DUF169 family)